jgi:hypothetical protein
MSPTYTVRKQSRYRYYVSQAVLQGHPGEAGSLARIGAAEIEHCSPRSGAGAQGW